MTVLFFVMIVLFMGLLLFGYRVGFQQRANSILIEAGQGSSATKPAEEPAPPVRRAPEEPEIRMENAPAPGDTPFLPTFAPAPDGPKSASPGLSAA
jgi:hypothetical protein